MEQPTVYLVIGDSAIAFDTSGEIVETVDWLQNGKPNWTEPGICDHRGAGGQPGYRALSNALEQAQHVAEFTGYDITHVAAA